MHCGASIGVLPLYASDASRSGQISFTRIRNARGVRETGNIVGIGILPCSQVMIVGSEDGIVRLCK